MRIFVGVCLMAFNWSVAGHAQEGHQPYAGLETRDIAALSREDIAQLEAGRGWGMALPAELNGYPGPAHVLELAEPLHLSDAQKDQIEKIFEDMQAEAIAAGADFIEAERALDRSFADGDVTVASLRKMTDAAALARGNLRFIHLSRHLQTIDILTDAQSEQYSILRGYAADPCASVPQGHDVTMWRRHNGCAD